MFITPRVRVHPLVAEVFIALSITAIMTALVLFALRGRGPADQHCRDVAGDSLQVYEACKRRQAEGE